MASKLLLATLCVASLAGQTAPIAAPDTAKPSKPASVSGRVVSNTGQPLKKTTITLRSMSGSSSGPVSAAPYSTQSDVEGKFTFDAVDPGNYMLSADRPGFQRQTYGARMGGSGGTVLSLTSDKTMSALEIVMSPQIVISGKILDSDGDPIGRVQVRALRMLFFNGRRQLTPTSNAITDENGEYILKNLGTGKYYVNASPANNGMFGEAPRSAAAAPPDGQPVKQEEAMVQTYYPGTTDSAAAQIIELTPGHDRPGTDITLQKKAVYHVRGKVSGAIPNERSQARVMVTPKSAMFFEFGNMTSPVGKDGSFDVGHVPPGSYTLTLANFGGNLKSLGNLPINVANRNLDEITLTAEPSFDLTGHLIVEKKADAPVGGPAQENSGAPVSRVFLQSVDSSVLNQVNNIVSEDSSFTLTGVSPGLFRVQVNPLPPDTYVKSIRYGDQDVLENNLSLPPGGSSTPLDITLGTHPAKVSGTVQDIEGKPAKSATVTLIPDPQVPDQTDRYKQTNTDQNGAFSLRGIKPGKYRIFAWEEFENGIQFDPDFVKTYETKGSKLELEESGSGQVTLTFIKQQ